MQPIYILQPLSSAAAAIAEIEVPATGCIKIGREAMNDIALPHDLQMSSSHFELSAEAGGCRVRDLKSSNGLFLNTKRIFNALLVEGDELQAGESRWRVVVRSDEAAPSVAAPPFTTDTPLDRSRSLPPVAVPPTARRSAVEENNDTATDLQLSSDRGLVRRLSPSQILTVGRTDWADWVFHHDGQMSSLHMEIFQYAGTWRVKDLESSNGTYLNETRIEEARLRAGDELRVGQTRFVVALLPNSQPPLETPAVPRADTPRSTPTGSRSGNTRPPSKPMADTTPPVTARPIRPGLGPLGTTGQPLSAGPGLRRAVVRRVADGREYELLPGKTTALGRGLDLPISLPEDLEVSTQHATLLFDGQSVLLQDTRSSNGTFVGGQCVTSHRLGDGQRFRVGNTELLVCLPPLVSQTELDFPISPSPAEATRGRSPTTPVVAANHLPQPSENRAAVNVPYRRVEMTSSEPKTQAALDPDTPHSSAPVSVPNSPRSTTTQPAASEATQPESAPTSAANAEWSSTAPDRVAQPPTPQPQTPQPQTPQPHTAQSHTPQFQTAQESASQPLSDGATTADSTEGGLDAQQSPNWHQPTPPDVNDVAPHSTPPASPRESAPPPTVGPDANIYESPSVSDAQPNSSAAEAIDWDSSAGYASQASQLQATTCRSGLIVYRGLSSGLDPVDVGLRVLQTTGGWVLNGGDIENWMEAAQQGLGGLPREWLNPARADDASWMLPFLSNWGSGKAWLVFASVELDDALQNVLHLRPIAEDAPPLMPALTPSALANFLAEHDSQAVSRFFQPFDAILVEIQAGQRWALFSRRDLQASLQQL